MWLTKIIFILSCGLMLIGCAGTNPVIERKNYNSWENDVGYTQVVIADNRMYISGVTSQAATFEQQIDDVYITIKKILHECNLGTNDIVKEVVFTTDLDQLKSLIPVRKAHFDHVYPASSWVEVKRLWNKSNLIEVEVVVALPKS